MPAVPTAPLDLLTRVLTGLDQADLDHWFGPDADPTQAALDLAQRLRAEGGPG